MRRALECDVLVVGAGVAGVGAAIGAARTGASTVLVGDEAVPGGVAVEGMHRSMCGLFLGGKPPPTRPLNEGLAREIFRSLKERDSASVVTAMGRVYVLPFKTRHLVQVLLERLSAESALRVRFRTRLTRVEMDAAEVRSVVVEDEQGELEIGVRAVVDCTGEGAVVRLAGARCQGTPEQEIQLAGYSVRLECVQVSGDLLQVKVPYHLARGVADGELPLHAKFTQYIPGDVSGEGYLKLSVPPTMSDRDTRALDDARSVHRYLQQALPEFRVSRLAAHSSRVVDREGKRIVGEYTLTEDDVLAARKFVDGIVKSAWPIELWNRARGVRFKYLPEGEYYEIPLRCVKVAAIRNAWAAGRCISATHMAHASTRAMGTCISLGEKTGYHAVRSLVT